VAVAVAIAGVAAIAGIVTAWALHDGNGGHLAARQREVERRGKSVMPFDQAATMHRFTATETGGVETVTANDPADRDQIGLIRSHLARERDLFGRGDFSDPMAIHGMEMPGLRALERGAAAGSVQIRYEPLRHGARLVYSTTEPVLVDALHTWFDAQVMDHGTHATR
jgi:hypothetical protein